MLALGCTTVSIFSVDQVSSSNGDSINVWLPDPNIEYFTGGHIALFLIAFLFRLFSFCQLYYVSFFHI